MKALNLSIVFLLILSSARLAWGDDGDTGPLFVQTPPGWKLMFSATKELPVYGLIDSAADMPASLNFAPSDLPSSKSVMAAIVDSKGKKNLERLEDALKQQNSNIQKPIYSTGDFQGKIYSGSFAKISLQGDIAQVQFMFSDGKDTWSGQYMGSEKDWKQSIEILKGLRKNH